MIKTFKELYSRRELLINLIIRNLKIRYKGSVLGFFWSLLDPLFMMLVYFLFIKLMKFKIDLPYLLIGIILWQFLVLSINDSFGAVSGSANMIKKVYFPRIVLPISTIIANLVNFVLSLFVLALFLVLSGVKPSIDALWLVPLIVILQFIFCLGFGLFVSSSTVFFKDTHHFIGVFLMAWFFMTPVIYPVSILPEKYINVYFLNPMATILCLFRKAVMGQDFVWVNTMYLSLIIPFVLLFAGWRIFVKSEPFFADEL